MNEHGPQAVAPGSTSQPGLFTPVHPPETNVQSDSPSPVAGDRGTCTVLLDPFANSNPAIKFRHSGWADTRRRVREAFLRTGQTGNRIFDFAQCGAHAYVFQSVDDPDLYTLGGSTCHDRFCLPCGRERSRLIATNVKDKLESDRARFLTLTLRSTTESLRDLLAKLSRDFAALRRTKLWRHKVTGGVAFIEVKWFARTERWHVHLHSLIQGRYIPDKALSADWLRITGTSYIVDIRIASDNAHVTHYITKYASKPLDHTVVLQPDRLDEAVVALKGKRLCMTFGSWRGYKLTEPLESGTWIQLGTLHEIIIRAEAGEPPAMEALDALRVEYAPSTRAPPSAPVITACSSMSEQTTFTFGPSTTLFPDAYGTKFGPSSTRNQSRS